MDVLEFLKERRRMCLAHGACGGCPLEGAKCALTSGTSDEECEKIIAAVEQWSKEHPRKTRQSIFLEQWPETELDRHGVLQLCPSIVSAGHRRVPRLCTADRCANCRREFWMQEVE
nr:MAG TPA: hypothetical protein [Caudoviricetes sp.]